jgi:hypothetical protein
VRRHQKRDFVAGIAQLPAELSRDEPATARRIFEDAVIEKKNLHPVPATITWSRTWRVVIADHQGIASLSGPERR